MSVQKIIFTISDTHCQSCPRIIALDLEDAPGVFKVEASLESKQVAIDYDPLVTNPDRLAAVITQTGYTPQPKNETV